MIEKTPILIDCDPGHDDAIALLLAFSSDLLDVRGVSVTGGNQTLEKTLQNAKNVLNFANIEVEIAAGLDKPLFRELEIAPEVHGESGLDGPELPVSKYPTHDLNSIDFMYRKIIESSKAMTLVATGPLTNIAALLITYPDVKNNIKQISIMGGALVGGNWTASAEFNILVDPEAARIVFNSGIPIIMAGLDVTHKALIHDYEIEEIRAIDSPVAVMVAELLDFFYLFHKEQGFAGSPVHDPCAIAYLTHPDIFTTKDYFIDIETDGEYTTGSTVTDFYGSLNKEANVKALVDVDQKAFFQMIYDAMLVYKERGV